MRNSLGVFKNFLGLLMIVFGFIHCGSFQATSYYSDGIYSNSDVVVVRKKEVPATNNAYSAYFDEKAQLYQWNDQDNDSVVLTDINQLNMSNSGNSNPVYTSRPNWGGNTSSTQIIFQTTPWTMGWGGYWNNWAYFDAFQPYWGWNAWNRPYWNSWGWNRWNRWNRFNWGGFYTPFYGPRWGMGYWDAWQFGGNPYFYNYGYGFNNRWGNQRLWNNRINRRAQRPVRSASYRGEVPRDNNRRVVAERNVQARENGTLEVPPLVSQGRRNNEIRRSQSSGSINQTRRSSQVQEMQNRSMIDQMIRDLQSRGMEAQVVPRQQRSRSTVTPSSGGSRNAYSQSSSNYSKSKSNGNVTRRSNNDSSRSYKQSNSNSNYSRSTRSSSSSGRSYSSGRSGGRSSSRRQ